MAYINPYFFFCKYNLFKLNLSVSALNLPSRLFTQTKRVTSVKRISTYESPLLASTLLILVIYPFCYICRFKNLYVIKIIER